MDIIDAIILGIVEGVTEFLPISSTGHMILTAKLLGLNQTDFLKSFEVVIQLGSILAVIFIFKDKIFKDINLWKKLFIGFLPTAALGFTLYKLIKSLFFANIVAYMLIIGGIIFLIIEYFYKEKDHHTSDTKDISYKQAFLIGIFQSLAMIPGTSRSGATIIGGLLVGLKRKVATEFSFLLAVPTMFAATGYDIYKNYSEFDTTNILALIVGFITSFFVAVLVIKWFLKFIQKHTFIPFGIYRILIGIIFLLFII